MTDQPMSGARFARYVGVDPEKWAEQFLQAYAQADAVRTDADRQAFVAGWFKDAMQEAAGKAEAALVEEAARRNTEPPWRMEERERDTAWLDGTEWTPEQLDALKRRFAT